MRLRIATYLTVQRLLDEGSSPSAKEALRYVIVKARQKNVPTGYDHLETFDRIYRAYRIFQSRNKLIIQNYV
jgi:vancomycin permeability regulator SanA